jgi:Mg/Co/Ni transporter MgtE
LSTDIWSFAGVFCQISTYLITGLSIINIFFRNHKNRICRIFSLGALLGFFCGLTVAVEILSIQNGDMKIEDMHEPIFASLQNLAKNIKIASRHDPVIYIF